MSENSQQKLQRQLSDATIFIRDQVPFQPRIAMTLGSGLSALADLVENPVRLPFVDVPHFAPVRVQGHAGQLIFGQIHGLPVAVMQGRVHYYEGHDPAQVVFPTRVLGQLGVKTLLLTNAAGGLVADRKPGDLMVILDHINLTGTNPLRGENPDFLGPRFPDMSAPYDPALSELLLKILKEQKISHYSGVYCGVCGPSYETAAEVRFLQQIGAHAVGMSTVFETIAARHMGLRVAGLSCITNLATGLSQAKVTHDEVQEIAKLTEVAFAKVISAFILGLKSEARL